MTNYPFSSLWTAAPHQCSVFSIKKLIEAILHCGKEKNSLIFQSDTCTFHEDNLSLKVLELQI